MSDIGLAEIPVDEDERPLPPPPAPVKNALLDGPILPTLASLAWPNIMAFSAGTCVVIAETSYIGRLGVESLAAIALVFPCVMLTMTMSGGAMGGGVVPAPRPNSTTRAYSNRVPTTVTRPVVLVVIERRSVPVSCGA